MVHGVVQAAAHARSAVRVQPPALLFPFHDGIADVIVVADDDASPFFRFRSPRQAFWVGSGLTFTVYAGRILRLSGVLLEEQSVPRGE
jgi:hypothetical protein